MRRIVLLMLLSVVFYSGCNLFETNSSKNPNPVLILSDLAGNLTNTFQSGEHFQMEFTLKNTTGEDRTYGYSGFPVVFSIHQGDSLVATSSDGYLFAMVLLGGSVKSGETMSASWVAPNTKYQEPKVVLSPGTYQAKVSFPKFRETTIDPPSPVEFTVTK